MSVTLRRAAARCVLLVLAALGGGCLFLAPRPEFRPGAFRERTVILSVEGTPGLAFEGSYGTPSKSTTARGVVPAQFILKTSVGVVATFSKSGEEGELTVRVLVDGQERFRAPITGKDAPKDVDVDCRGAKRLTLVIDFGEDREVLDRAAWAGPILLKAGS